MDTMLVTISRIDRIKDAEGFVDEDVIQFYRQEIPMHIIYEHRPELMREIIALCNNLSFSKE